MAGKINQDLLCTGGDFLEPEGCLSILQKPILKNGDRRSPRESIEVTTLRSATYCNRGRVEGAIATTIISFETACIVLQIIEMIIISRN
jgi:hypothetical protein